MPMPRKPLWQLVRDKSFLARRHAHLLEKHALVDDPQLRDLQQSYREEADRWERYAIALRFEKACRRTEEELAWDRALSSLPPVDLARLLAGPSRKTLTERIIEGSFYTGRHAFLLLEDVLADECPLPGRHARAVWQHLRDLQELYLLAPAPDPQAEKLGSFNDRIAAREENKHLVRLRRRIVHQFAAAVRELSPRAPKPSTRGHASGQASSRRGDRDA